MADRGGTFHFTCRGPRGPPERGAVRPDAIHDAIRVLRLEVRKFEEGVVGQYSTDPFETLVSCILSLRTQDRVTDAASARLFARARTPRAILALREAELRKLIYPVCFYRTKAKSIQRICGILLERYGGRVPGDLDALLELPGVGRKTANLVVTLSFNKPGICVDTHVHRIVNRWGYVRTKTPEQTEMALRAKLPKRYWRVLNDLLVPYGQNLCRPLSPWCSRCRLTEVCDRVGVARTR